ncbi:redoxin domain-containing protein [Buchnera aphidicola (Ceratoglyphina bambusae)]|uniref:redoxin domain-containing protein n=1 Tax=Buchnera aphidicola TaxID=9 RepID=UPI0031B84398
MTLVTKQAPNFVSSAILKNNEIIDNFNFKKYIKNNITVLFFWPMDFTFVCPTEIIEFNKHYNKFKKNNVKIIGVSCDSIYSHYTWKNISIKNGGIGNLNYIIVSDIKKEIQKSYEIEHPKLGISLRATFLIDSDGIIKHEIVNDLPYGRSVKEIIRMIDALNFHKKNGYVCPSDWNNKKKGIHPSTEGLKKYIQNKT